MSRILREHRWAAALVLAYLAAAILYGVTIPIFETPDEGGHYAYIHELTEGRGLPVQGTPSGERVSGYVASHPPLYYALSAAITFWISDDTDYQDWARKNPYHAIGFPDAVGNKNLLVHDREAEGFPWHSTPLTVHIARLVSALLGAVVVVGTYGTAWELTQGRAPALTLGAAVLTAFTPMLVFTGARVANDGAVAAFGALTIWGATRLAVRGLSRRGTILLGATLGLAILSKLSGLTLAPAVALALLLDAFRNSQSAPRNSQLAIRNSLLLFATTALVCGWWFVRNRLLYGEWMGVNAWLSHTATVRPQPIGLLEVIPQLQGLEMSYWAMFGWFNIPVAPWMYRVWWVLVRLAAVGLLFLLVRVVRKRRSSRVNLSGLTIVAVSFLLVFGSAYRFIMIVLGAQGRYLIPASAAISTLLMLGLSQLVGRRAEPPLAATLAAAHLTAVLASLFLFILPAYAPPQPVTEADLPPDMTRFAVAVDGTPIRLIGGRIEAEEARPGDRVDVSLYWLTTEHVSTDYVAHVRLLGRDGARIGGTDGYPGSGTFPPDLWEPGVIYRDRYTLPVDGAAQTPVLMGLEAGLRVQGEPPLPLTLPSGEPWPGTLLLDVVPLRPLHPPSTAVSHPVEARLGQAITLVGADLSATRLEAGGTLTVTLVWQGEEAVTANYTVFVHLLDQQGQLVAQADAPPLGGAYPTAYWMAGDVVRDPHRLDLPADLPTTTLLLQVGLYDPTTDARLDATDADGNPFAENAIPVATLEVR